MKSYKGVVSRYIENDKRSVVPIFISIILTITVITSVSFITQNIMRNDLEEKKLEFGDYDVRLQKINSERLEKIRNHENIKDYAVGKTGILKYSITSKYVDQGIYEVNMEEYAVERKVFDEYINFNVAEGRLPTSENEIVVDRILKSQLSDGTKLGDTIDATLVNSYEEERTEGKGVSYTIVGIIETNSKDMVFNNKIIRLLSEEEISNSEEELEVFTYLHDSLKVEELANDLGILYILPNRNMMDLPFGYPKADIKYPGYEKDEYMFIRRNLVSITIISVISLFCLMAVYNTFHASIAKRIRVYGILRAVGGSMKQIRNLIYLEALILYLVSVPIGLLLGYVLTKAQSNILVNNIRILEKFTMDFNLEIIIITLISSLVIILYSIISVLRKEGKLTPIEAIVDARGLGRKKKSVGSNLMGQSLSGSGSDEDEREALKEIMNYEKSTFKFKIMKKIFKFEGEVAHKNITVDSDSYKLSKRTLFLAMSILIFFYLQVLNNTVSINNINNDLNFDVELTLTETGLDKNVIDEMKAIKGVEEVYRTSYEQVHLFVPIDILSSELISILSDKKSVESDGKESKKISAEIMTLDEKSIELYDGIDKKALDNGGVLLVNKATNWKIVASGGEEKPAYAYFHSDNVLKAKEPDILSLIKRGEVINEGYFEKRYNENVKVDELNIVGNVDDDLVYSKFKSTNHEELSSNIKLLTTEEGLNKILEPYENSKILVRTKNGEGRADTINELRKISANNNYEVKDKNKTKMQLERNLKDNLGLNIILATTIVIMVVLNLVNTTNAVILARRKELAGMRAIGMSSRQQRKMIIAEVFYISLSVAFNVILIVGSYTIVNQGPNIGAGKVMVQNIFIGEILIIIFLMIVSNLTSLAPLAQAKKFSIVEDLKDE